MDPVEYFSRLANDAQTALAKCIEHSKAPPLPWAEEGAERSNDRCGSLILTYGCV